MAIMVILFGCVAGLLSGAVMLVQGHGLLAALMAYPVAGLVGAMLGLGWVLLRRNARTAPLRYPAGAEALRR
ncbi:hypothetical protein [Ruixingdingia sedimenti]|uniref:Major facilitator superfamily (MFS) profile domain-containing protein n=1 Tax=Ruixingdingia sedimenti TaxID=3073604 RepID=A0ABU1F8Q5_9RHOB|nr:hypothetical protein [Xinfangfangia sp. LG-4]MDR5652839.1 hypothetical protein [Xinfangfangia sp. LG-4]